MMLVYEHLSGDIVILDILLEHRLFESYLIGLMNRHGR
jgi:hypothetical protein